MIRPVLALVAILIVCGEGKRAVGQIQLPKGIQIPSQLDWQDIYNNRVVNLYEGLKPFTSPDEKSPKLDAPLKYLETYYFVHKIDQRTNSRSESWYLLVRLDDETGNKRKVRITQHLGWVPRKYVAERGEALKDPNTEVHIKAFLRIPVAHFSGDSQSEVSSVEISEKGSFIRPRKKPEDSAELMEAIRFYNFFFVMAKTGDNGERDWVFLSSQYELGEGTIPLGWVQRKYVEEWLTREAIQWSTDPARPKRPGKIWPTPEAALAAGPEDLSNRDGFLFVERFDDKNPIEQPPEWPRYPVLRWDQEERYRQEILKYPGWRLLKTSVPGGFVDEKGYPSVNSEEILALQQRLHVVQQRAKQLEIVFVIDDTESMRPWFPVAAKAVEDIVQVTQRLRNQVELKVGVVFYNDENPKVPGHRPVTVIPLVSQENIPQLISNIKNHRVSAGGDPREMVFEGIIQAIRNSNFSAEAIKLLIVIGDDGDKSNENDIHHDAERRIISELNSFTVPVSFAAIQAYPPERVKDRSAAAAFRKQMETIVSLYNEHIMNKHAPGGEGKILGVLTPGVYTTNDSSRVAQVISDVFQDLLKQHLAIQDQIKLLRLGQFGAAANISALSLILKDRGLNVTIDKLKNTKGFQLVLDGYVWVPDGSSIHVLNNRSSTEYVLFLSSAEIEQALSSLQRFIRNLGDRWDNEAVKELLQTSLGEQIKSDFEKMIIKMCALQAAGERIKRVLDLTMTLDDLSELVVRSMRLTDILRDEECEYRRVQNGWIRGNCQTKPRGYLSVDGLVKYYWVRVRNEWP